MTQKTLELNVLDNFVNLTFACHETFHPRWGWLKKGFEMSCINSRIFLAESAPVKLGIGKNMVRSLRYWCNAFKVTDEKDQPTEFGKKLLQIQLNLIIQGCTSLCYIIASRLRKS